MKTNHANTLSKPGSPQKLTGLGAVGKPDKGNQMANHLFDGDTFEHKGRAFVFRAEHDDCSETPWERENGHGPVSDWTSRDKAPGERVLASDCSSKRYYDFAEAVKIAKRDGWGLGRDDEMNLAQTMGRAPTREEIIAASVEADYELLRRWCNDDWCYLSICVEHVESGRKEYLGGVDSDSSDYVAECAHELADEIVYELDEQMARDIAASRPDMAPAY